MIYFVTREKDNAKSIVLSERELPIDKDFEILLDEEISKEYKDVETQIQKFLLRRLVIWSEQKPRQELIEILTDQLNCSKRTIVIRLKQIIDAQLPIVQNTVNCTLCTRADGKELIYYLSPMK